MSKREFVWTDWPSFSLLLHALTDVIQKCIKCFLDGLGQTFVKNSLVDAGKEGCDLQKFAKSEFLKSLHFYLQRMVLFFLHLLRWFCVSHGLCG